MKKKLNKTEDIVIRIKTEEGLPFEVPEKGSLGLLALGHIGLLAWRKKRFQVKNNIEKKSV